MRALSSAPTLQPASPYTYSATTWLGSAPGTPPPSPQHGDERTSRRTGNHRPPRHRRRTDGFQGNASLHTVRAILTTMPTITDAHLASP
jgi:hypothetical protein